MLEVKDLGKSYGSRVAVSGVSLIVEPGTFYGLLGPNGAGKTTTLSMLSGTVDADRGSVTWSGEAIRTSASHAKRRLGYVPQELALYEELSAFDNLRFFGALYNLTGAELERRIGFGLDVAGLQSRTKGPVRAYSGGMKRRLNLAAALLHDPELLILDEPTVGVDPQSRNLIFDALEKLQADGKTILYTTHYMEEVERLCSRVAIMDHGTVIAEGTLPELHRMVPARPTVRFELKSELAALPTSRPGVVSARRDGASLTVEVDGLDETLPGLLEFITREGGLVESIRSERPTLEEVFLHLTGRQLRD